MVSKGIRITSTDMLNSLSIGVEIQRNTDGATRFVTRNYVYETGSMTDILGQSKWESLKKRRKDNRLVFVIQRSER